MEEDCLSAATAASLAQARILYSVLADCEKKLDALDAKAKTAKISYADLYNVMQDVFIILKEMGLPDDTVKAIMILQRLITTTHSLIIAMNALMIASGGTAPLLIAGLGVGASIVSMISMVGSYG